MKNSLENKIKSYSAMAAGMLAASSLADAQIVYHDVDPDVNISDSTYLLNLDNDTAIDFRLVQAGYFYYSTSFLNLVGVQALKDNEILGDTAVTGTGSYTSTNFLPKALKVNDLIDGNQKIWANSYSAIMYAKGAYYGNIVKIGDWQNVTDRYLGLKFKIGNDWHYGWARLDVAQNAASFTLKDYAYEKHPNKKILAGVKISAIDETSEQILTTYFSNNHIVVNVMADITPSLAAVYNLMGEKLMETTIMKGSNVINQSLSSGVYIIKFNIHDQFFTRKIIIP